MGPIEQFKAEGQANIAAMGENRDLKALSETWIRATVGYKYTYNFSWLGRPIIQYPTDIVMVQELIWTIQPDLIIETGIAHGGSLILSASILELNAACGGPQSAEVLGIDIDIRSHNRDAIEAHPMFKRISMIQGSSIAPEVIERVRIKAAEKNRVLVLLDSNHTHEHVLAELRAYAPLVAVGSYCVVFDTNVDDVPPDLLPANRPWGPGNNPKTAVRQFLKESDAFMVDREIENKLLITVAPEGWLKRIR